jgi:hypothetical protein
MHYDNHSTRVIKPTSRKLKRTQRRKLKRARSNWRYAVVGTLPEFVIYVTAKLLN